MVTLCSFIGFNAAKAGCLFAGSNGLPFANQQDTTAIKRNVPKYAQPKDPFPTEKSFKIDSAVADVFKFKKGDVIRISTKNGLKHYRNKKLVNTYKLIPQQGIVMIQPNCLRPPCPPIESTKLIYYLGAHSRFIDVRGNKLLISSDSFTAANTPDTPIKPDWKIACHITKL